MTQTALQLSEHVITRIPNFDINEVKKDFNAFVRNDKWATKVAPLWWQAIVKELKNLNPETENSTLTIAMFKGVILFLTQPAELKAA